MLVLSASFASSSPERKPAIDQSSDKVSAHTHSTLLTQPPTADRAMAPPTKHKPPRRTMELPASLRAELQELGHLPKPGKGKLGRKEKRKAARNDSKANRAAHFAQKAANKRKADGEHSDPEPEAAPAPVETKRRKVDTKLKEKPTPLPAVEEPKKKKTTLEKMLDKQTRAQNGGVDPERKKNVAETNEDKEIAWLEAKLGVRGGPPVTAKEKGKGKWKDEYADDGLDGKSARLGVGAVKWGR